MKKNIRFAASSAAAFVLTAAMGMNALAVYSPEQNGPDSETPIYNEYGAHAGLDASTENASLEGIYTQEAADEYIHEGTYIITDHLDLTNEYTEPGVYYETTDFTFGSGLYVVIQDEKSPSKFYTLIKSAQDLEIGQPYIYRDGDIGGRLLDDKYTSTHMLNNYQSSNLSYVSYDMGGGKLSAQQAQMKEDGTPEEHQADGFTYIYLVSESPADYFQRLANEEAGYETPAQSEDRQYMPVNNTQQSGEPLNNWSNLTEDDSRDYNDRITKIGGTEGNSNTRLYSYSGQNVIVAKFAVSIEEAEAQFTYSESAEVDPDADYTLTEGEITIGVGETLPLRFHTQFTSTWGRDGYGSGTATVQIDDPTIVSYVGKSQEEGAQSYVLTGLKGGTTTITATLQDSEGMFDGGQTIVLTVNVI